MKTNPNKAWTWLLLIAVISSAALCIGWGKKARTAEDLMKLAAVGASLIVDASGKDVDDLVKIAAVTGSGGGTLYLKGCGGFETDDLMKIAVVGRGHVVLEF